MNDAGPPIRYLKRCVGPFGLEIVKGQTYRFIHHHHVQRWTVVKITECHGGKLYPDPVIMVRLERQGKTTTALPSFLAYDKKE